jgi:hypothetical protein
LKKVAILQSNYVPWKGYFDIIHDVDVCILYDCVQFTCNDWRNRNQLLVGGKKKWLTIPVRRMPLETPINRMEINNTSAWQDHHYHVIEENYREAPFLKETLALLEPFVAPAGMSQNWTKLSAFNQSLIRTLCRSLGIATELVDSAQLDLQGCATDRVLDAVKKVGGTFYLSGPSASDYLELAKFRAKEVDLVYKDYAGYPPYPQFSKTFDHQVSILDLLAQTGPRAPEFIWGWRG